jgi:hypothetical protein
MQNARTKTWNWRDLELGCFNEIYHLGCTGTDFVTIDNVRSFVVYGTLLLACSAGTPVQKVVIDQVQAGKAFEDLGGNPPRARHMGVVGDFLVLAGLPDTPQTVRWSNSGNIEQWPLGQLDQEGDEQQLPDGGAVTGFAGGEYGVIFQERHRHRPIDAVRVHQGRPDPVAEDRQQHGNPSLRPGGFPRRRAALGRHEGRPEVHELTALLQGVAAAIGELDLVADQVRERRFDHFAREVGLVAGPVAEAGAESMGRDPLDLGPPVQRLEHHVGEHTAFGVGEDEVLAADRGEAP